ncbi:MAG: tRNA(Ile)(2)-agmatinylcytidine synthase [Methanocorpusculum sp.]|uniref:tRNA(Ile)(2)-agmatinylcytidine synthase n=1 Tax=Methanocorpusculum sp. TaxID=2058474 RepID=UPI002719E879|nr:tRNA(Ile)(2)-agmatinylcytidine synthase [Methanocorpusculum sp.]MDO9522983.1 tRNA(Ile)(2)-agmatinylcytidine synthase [Methanocorpusculum sp.]
MLLGLDDTDSPDGMCTTYLGALIADELERLGYEVTNHRLVRLNPNVIWKTRGNAAICIEILGGDPKTVFDIACGFVDRFAQFDCEKTNPGVVVVDSPPDPAFYFQTLQRFCTIEETVSRLERIGALYKGYKNGRGLIGALAAVSSVLPDKTFECLAYRKADVLGTPRIFEKEGFFTSEDKTAPHTWDTVDFIRRDIVCVPHGKDPVLYGIRGDTPEWVEKATGFLDTEEPAFSQIWETNQGTDAHLLSLPYGGPVEGESYRFFGVVESAPRTNRGGHVQFTILANGESIQVFAFEPTKYFRNAVRELACGDRITVCGSFQKGILHLEKFRPDRLTEQEHRSSPRCPICGGRMTSAGKDKGYKCRECSARVRDVESRERTIQTRWYEVPPGSRRHLAKPAVRMRD